MQKQEIENGNSISSKEISARGIKAFCGFLAAIIVALMVPTAIGEIIVAGLQLKGWTTEDQ